MRDWEGRGWGGEKGERRRQKKTGEKMRGNRGESKRDLTYSKREISAAAAQKLRMALVAQKAACGSGVRSGVRPSGWDNVRRRLHSVPLYLEVVCEAACPFFFMRPFFARWAVDPESH